MNFDFSDELKQLRNAARSFLARESTRAATRGVLEGSPVDRGLWQAMAGLGWLGAAIPEEHGGLGLGPLATCVLAEELGYAVAPVPFAASVYLATTALVAYGSPAQQARWLPRLAEGSAIGCCALAEGPGPLAAVRCAARVDRNGLTGTKTPVADAVHADFAIVVACSTADVWLHLVELEGRGVTRTPLTTLDASRPHATLNFAAATAEPLDRARGWHAVQQLLERAAVPLAFEQVGGAQAALEMARDYALQRYAFGRPIGSFQAIKHKLADTYLAVELARSNAYYGAWALAAMAPELPVAAAAARISACEAAWIATRDNIQVHGGMGYTWELDCHLYYRRARDQALLLGSAREWKRHLMDAIAPRAGAPVAVVEA